MRTLSRSLVIALVVLLSAIMLVRQHVLATEHAQSLAPQTQSDASLVSTLSGTNLRGASAPSFALHDQSGKLVSLASLQGSPVVLTFIDATSTDQDPLTVQYLDSVAHYLGTQSSHVAWVALSVNANNTSAQASTFLKSNQVQVPLHVLLGTQQQLSPVLRGYHIAVDPGKTNVQHTVGVYLIDGKGHEIEWLAGGFNPQQFAADVQSVLNATR